MSIQFTMPKKHYVHIKYTNVKYILLRCTHSKYNGFIYSRKDTIASQLSMWQKRVLIYV